MISQTKSKTQSSGASEPATTIHSGTCQRTCSPTLSWKCSETSKTTTWRGNSPLQELRSSKVAVCLKITSICQTVTTFSSSKSKMRREKRIESFWIKLAKEEHSFQVWTIMSGNTMTASFRKNNKKIMSCHSLFLMILTKLLKKKCFELNGSARRRSFVEISDLLRQTKA